MICCKKKGTLCTQYIPRDASIYVVYCSSHNPFAWSVVVGENDRAKLEGQEKIINVSYETNVYTYLIGKSRIIKLNYRFTLLFIRFCIKENTNFNAIF